MNKVIVEEIKKKYIRCRETKKKKPIEGNLPDKITIECEEFIMERSRLIWNNLKNIQNLKEKITGENSSLSQTHLGLFLEGNHKSKEELDRSL